MTDEQEDEKGCNLPQRAPKTIVFLVYFYFAFIILLLYFVNIIQSGVFVLHVYPICIVFAVQEDWKGTILHRSIRDKQTIKFASLLTCNSFCRVIVFFLISRATIVIYDFT